MKTAHKIISGVLIIGALLYGSNRLGYNTGKEKGHETGYARAMAENEENRKMYRLDIFRTDEQIERVALVTVTKDYYAIDLSSYDAKESLSDIANREFNENKRKSGTDTKDPFEIDTTNKRLNLRIKYDQNIDVILLQSGWTLDKH